MIAIPIKSKDKNALIDERFGRASFFYIYNDIEFKIVDNSAKDASSGAGGLAVKLLSDENVDTIISPHIGPKAMEVIKQLGISVYEKGESTGLADVMKLFKDDKLTKLETKPQGLKRV